MRITVEGESCSGSGGGRGGGGGRKTGDYVVSLYGPRHHISVSFLYLLRITGIIHCSDFDFTLSHLTPLEFMRKKKAIVLAETAPGGLTEALLILTLTARFRWTKGSTYKEIRSPI